MIRTGLISAVIFAAACSAQVPEAQVEAQVDTPAETQAQAPAPEAEPIAPSKQAAPLRGAIEVAAPISPGVFRCDGVPKQGGALLCQTTPFAGVKVGRSATKADASGKVIIGFDRDAAKKTIVKITHASGEVSPHPISVEPRKYKEQRIDGLPPSQVSTYSDADLKRIRSSSARKKVGFASNAPEIYFENGFDYPIKEFVKTSPFGSRRILNGEPKSPHYGVDIAAPLGTPIYAPAGGVVGLADDDLYFEGAMVMIDHGQGLNSLYLHVNDIFVQPGDIVKRGDLIAEVGSKGRSTGPHLCWRLKWKRENLDPELLTQWPGK